MTDTLHALLLAWMAYAIGVASPGPATLLIANTSMAHGRRNGLAVAAGVMVGSLFWATLAAMGLAVVLTAYGWLAGTFRVLAGLYLIYLAIVAGRKAFADAALAPGPVAGRRLSGDFRRGLFLHLTNPKAVFVWLATISLGMPAGAPASQAFLVVGTCVLLGSVIVATYAILFATARAQRAYRAAKRWIDGTTALVFATAGIALLAKRT